MVGENPTTAARAAATTFPPALSVVTRWERFDRPGSRRGGHRMTHAVVNPAGHVVFRHADRKTAERHASGLPVAVRGWARSWTTGRTVEGFYLWQGAEAVAFFESGDEARAEARRRGKEATSGDA